MPAFTLYNAADFRDSVPENVRDEFINALDNYEAARQYVDGEDVYLSREDIFAACLRVAVGDGLSAPLAFGDAPTRGSVLTYPCLVFAKLTPADVYPPESSSTDLCLRYLLHAGGERIGSASHPRYSSLTTENIREARVRLFDNRGEYRVAEYAYANDGVAAPHGWDGCDSPLANGSYVLLELTHVR